MPKAVLPIAVAPTMLIKYFDLMVFKSKYKITNNSLIFTSKYKDILNAKLTINTCFKRYYRVILKTEIQKIILNNCLPQAKRYKIW